MNQKFKHLIGKQVTVDWRGLDVPAKLISLPEKYGGRDCEVRLLTEKRTRRVWASKV